MSCVRVALLLLGAVLLGGCIPVRRQTLLCPAGAVQARDAASAAPLAGARVVVRRFRLGPPPRMESHRITAVTGADGRAAFGLQTGHEWVMPLMMHGVPQWAFDVCVDAPEHQGASATWLIQGMSTQAEDLRPRPDLLVPLAPGSGGCEASPEWQGFMTQIRSRPPQP